MKKVLIKTNFFIDTDLFQHYSQFESSLMDFFAAHGAEMERIMDLSSGDDSKFYTVRRMQVMIPIAQPKSGESLNKKMQEVKKQTNPSLKKNPRPLVKISVENRPKRTFNAGSVQLGKIQKLSMGTLPAQGT